MNKVVFKCKGCGWEGRLVETWADIKPSFCPNSKCEFSKTKSKGKKSFRSNPEMLEVILPKKKESKPVKKSSRKKQKEKKQDEEGRQGEVQA